MTLNLDYKSNYSSLKTKDSPLFVISSEMFIIASVVFLGFIELPA